MSESDTIHCLNITGCDPSDLVLVTNATTAINTVVKGISLQKGDRVYMLSTTYGMILEDYLSIDKVFCKMIFNSLKQ